MPQRIENSSKRVWHEWEVLRPEFSSLFLSLSTESPAYLILQQLVEKYPSPVTTQVLLDLFPKYAQLGLRDLNQIICAINELAKSNKSLVEIDTSSDNEYRATIKAANPPEMYIALGELTLFQKRILLLLLKFELSVHDLEEIMTAYGYAIAYDNNEFSTRLSKLRAALTLKQLGTLKFNISTKKYRFTINPRLNKDKLYESLLQDLESITQKHT